MEQGFERYVVTLEHDKLEGRTVIELSARSAGEAQQRALRHVDGGYEMQVLEAVPYSVWLKAECARAQAMYDELGIVVGIAAPGVA